jgi:hypothetical protein
LVVSFGEGGSVAEPWRKCLEVGLAVFLLSWSPALLDLFLELED